VVNNWGFMTVYGYARQHHGTNAGRTEATLHEAGAAKVFKEKISGAANHRAQLHRLLKTIDIGTLSSSRADRLARSTRDLLNILDRSRKQARLSNRLATLGQTRPRPTDD
jgi:DNA invertase Pin-like site-specific DNA recombinase